MSFMLLGSFMFQLWIMDRFKLVKLLSTQRIFLDMGVKGHLCTGQFFPLPIPLEITKTLPESLFWGVFVISIFEYNKLCI